MIESTIKPKRGGGFEDAFKKLFKFRGYNIPKVEIADLIATSLIGRVRKRFLTQTNPDGSSWAMTAAARKRMAGGRTYAKGGKFAPGGYKTGGNILFASGNLFHSIQLVKIGVGKYSIRTDVPYAKYWQNDAYTIIGAEDSEISTLLNRAVRAFL